MAWKFQNDRPIYTQLLEQIEQKIISGEYPKDSKLPSVRDLAQEAAVNPNTMQRAMVELERMGLIITNRTAGRTVTGDESIIMEIKKNKAIESTKEYLNKMLELGFDKKEIIEMIEKGE